MDMGFRTVELPGDGVVLVADAVGDPRAMPVLFLHGGGQSRRSWRAAAKRVAEAGYYGLTVDLRGHGDSGWAPDGDYSLPVLGRDVERLLVAFARPVALVGASRGGQAALVGGTAAGRKVRLIMLADVAPLIAATGVDRIRAFLQHSLGGFPTVEAAADALSDFLDRPRMADATPLARALRRRADGRLHWHWDPRTAASEFINPPAETEIMAAAAAGAHCRVVLVRAEHSDIVTDASVAHFRELTPQLEVVTAKGAGHMFTSDQNDVFAATLLAQLQQELPP